MTSGDTNADPWLLPTLSPSQVLAAEGCTLVDLRSPSEFEQDHLPGAHSRPLFDDLERALVGTLYKRESARKAFDEGRRIVIEGISELVCGIAASAGRELGEQDLAGRVRELTSRGLEGMNRSLCPEPAADPPPGALILHCWRGGLRSGSVAALLRAIGWQQVYLLEGGYKAYRKEVMRELEDWQAPPVVVIRGMTGTGKTLVLREIERLRPGWTIDLEGCAGHRSSILGMVGLEPCSQKLFESRLADRLRAGFPGPVIFEGESRKVGDVIIPRTLWEALRGGVDLNLVAGIPCRVEVLCADYLALEGSRGELRRQLPFIEQRLGPRKWAGRLVGLLDEQRDAELVELLLEHYYDPLYRHSEQQRDHRAQFDSEDPGRAAREIIAWVEQSLGVQAP